MRRLETNMGILLLTHEIASGKLGFMKKLIALILLGALAGCDKERKNASSVEMDNGNTVKMKLVEFEGCEWIITLNTTNHKPTCKFCAERSRIAATQPTQPSNR